jgi:hypothetical protein
MEWQGLKNHMQAADGCGGGGRMNVGFRIGPRGGRRRLKPRNGVFDCVGGMSMGCGVFVNGDDESVTIVWESAGLLIGGQ